MTYTTPLAATKSLMEALHEGQELETGGLKDGLEVLSNASWMEHTYTQQQTPQLRLREGSAVLSSSCASAA